MKEKPILFSGEMVRAILSGSKTQTRRVVKLPRNPRGLRLPYPPHEVEEDGKLFFQDEYGDYYPIEHIATYQPGDRLWVRETWREDDSDPSFTYYRADVKQCSKWRPSIFMPRNRSRITLQITGVRVERLQDIDNNGAYAEGAPDLRTIENNWELRDCFEHLWDSINGKKKGCSWEDNPWVWVIEFKRIEP